MIIARIEGANRVCGQEQGYLGLPIRDEKIDGMNVMHMAFEPTPAELEKLLQGGKIIVSIIGNNPPPIILTVGN